MDDLKEQLSNEVRALVDMEPTKYRALTALTNDVIDPESDFEHIITLLDDSPSQIHKHFAEDLREIFERTLRDRLEQIESELGPDRFKLYAALLDMYQVPNCPEQLHAIFTLNYDLFMEDAARSIYPQRLDYGIRLEERDVPSHSLNLIKLHGSFGWKNTWPIAEAEGREGPPLWIPPGIRKAKEHYPFNVLWGRAREWLDCDVLRIIGCKLGESDWDLISLLFSRHVHSTNEPYTVEVIDSPEHAKKLQQAYPYLDIKSILEIDTMDIGDQVVGEATNGPPQPFSTLSAGEKDQARRALGRENWFRMWLIQMAEALYRELGDLTTATGQFRQLLEEV